MKYYQAINGDYVITQSVSCFFSSLGINIADIVMAVDETVIKSVDIRYQTLRWRPSISVTVSTQPPWLGHG